MKKEREITDPKYIGSEGDQIAKDQTIARLNDLIVTCEDGRKGYHLAAGAIADPVLSDILESYGQERGQFAADLRAAVRRAGGEPENCGSIPAAVMRGWMNLSTLVNDGDPDAILPECERSENFVLDRYSAAMQGELPWELEQLVEKQYFLVLQARERLRVLERARLPHH
jgi:uncharacterized protein (TIGR02284 family)